MSIVGDADVVGFKAASKNYINFLVIYNLVCLLQTVCFSLQIAFVI
jgi:hypothetical protein